jgi:hypothetical protein
MNISLNRKGRHAVYIHRVYKHYGPKQDSPITKTEKG